VADNTLYYGDNLDVLRRYVADAVESFLSLSNEIGRHESLGWRAPLALHRGGPHLFRG
jgi:hypothetical protein